MICSAYLHGLCEQHGFVQEIFPPVFQDNSRLLLLARYRTNRAAVSFTCPKGMSSWSKTSLALYMSMSPSTFQNKKHPNKRMPRMRL